MIRGGGVGSGGGGSNFRPTGGYDKDWANGGNNCVGSCMNERERTQ